jgi:hypothetical protein
MGGLNANRIPIILIMGLLFGGCGASYRMWPKYYELHDRIQTIALYPLLYCKGGDFSADG